MNSSIQTLLHALFDAWAKSVCFHIHCFCESTHLNCSRVKKTFRWCSNRHHTYFSFPLSLPTANALHLKRRNDTDMERDVFPLSESRENGRVYVQFKHPFYPRQRIYRSRPECQELGHNKGMGLNAITYSRSLFIQIGLLMHINQ